MIPDDFHIDIGGETYLITVTHYYNKKPDYNCSSSDWDYYGYTEFEFIAMDSYGNECTTIDDEYDAILDEYNRIKGELKFY